MRVSEHLRISEFTDKKMNSKAKTSIYAHMEECNHQNTMEDFGIINSGSLPSNATEYILQLRESLLIAKDNPSINKAVRSVPLKLF